MTVPLSPPNGERQILLKNPIHHVGIVWRSLTMRLGLGGGLFVVLLVCLWLVAVFWSREPDLFDVKATALERFHGDESKVVVGVVVTSTLMRVAQTLLDKPGGYISNDKTPPGVLMDDMPNWEFGVLTQVRVLAQAMRNDFSRSQSQSSEDPDLAKGESQFNFDNNSWIMPATETEYRAGLAFFDKYLNRLSDQKQTNAQFFARADNLASWIDVVSKRLGGISQKLRSSVGQNRINTDLSGDPSAQQSTPVSEQELVKTPWLLLDDVFYEARGNCWALLHFLRAMEVVVHSGNSEPSFRPQGVCPGRSNGTVSTSPC
ncbi:MAG: DUF2333 family protein [Magnetococcales bacterium]|nr:DUF2333 family protein [Magnetococcales bacterium]